MASPQKEDGFTPISNEILEALSKTNVVISHYEWQCLIFIFRKTYGWAKSTDRISLSQFVLGTSIKRPHICRALKKLINKRVITQSGNGVSVSYSFQKDYDKWKPLPKQVIITQSGNKVVPNQVMGGVPNQGHTKETLTKETIQKKDPKYPTLEEVKDYFSKNSIPLDAVSFFNHYDSADWFRGKTKIKKWKACVQTWLSNKKNYGGNNGLDNQERQRPVITAADIEADQSSGDQGGNQIRFKTGLAKEKSSSVL